MLLCDLPPFFAGRTGFCFRATAAAAEVVVEVAAVTMLAPPPPPPEGVAAVNGCFDADDDILTTKD